MTVHCFLTLSRPARLTRNVSFLQECIVATKRDIVESQLKTAIRLFFEERDAVSIHTLIASAHQILFDIGKQKGVTSAIKATKNLRGSEVAAFLKSINYPYNFIKHADKDQDKEIHLGPLLQLTQDFIMDAIVMFQNLYGDIPIEAKVYWHWFVSKYPQDFDNLPEDSEIKKMQAQGLPEWSNKDILEFLEFANIVGEVS